MKISGPRAFFDVFLSVPIYVKIRDRKGGDAGC